MLTIRFWGFGPIWFQRIPTRPSPVPKGNHTALRDESPLCSARLCQLMRGFVKIVCVPKGHWIVNESTSFTVYIYITDNR